MPTFQSNELIQDLEKRIQEGINTTTALKRFSIKQLKTQPQNGGWSIAEVLVHLNFYANFYTKATQTAMNNSHQTAADSFTTGWLGNYFTNIIGPAPENGELKKKMTSPSNAKPAPIETLDAEKELDTYLNHQTQLLKLLEQAKLKNLQKIRVSISISPFIKLRLGDTFRFVVAHQERHGQQIGRLVDGL